MTFIMDRHRYKQMKPSFSITTTGHAYQCTWFRDVLNCIQAM